MMNVSSSFDPSRTQVDATLAAAERRYATEPERAELIKRTRRFKSSWIELAEALSDCRERTRYQAWGYGSFEDYYRKELHLKASTVDKLIGSYAFLHKSAPDVLRRDGLETHIPSYQSVDFLRRAEEAFEAGRTDQTIIDEVRQAVLEESSPLPKVSRLFRKTLFPEDTEQDQKKKLQEVAKLAKRLLELLASLQTSLPRDLTKQMEEVIGKLLTTLPMESAVDNPSQDAA